MTAIGPDLRKRRAARFKWAMLTALTLLILTVLVGFFFAITASAPTAIETDGASGTLKISGPESDFVGTVDGMVDGQHVHVAGLPAFKDVRDNPLAARAMCMLRNDPKAQWAGESEMLRAHLNSPEMNKICESQPAA